MEQPEKLVVIASAKLSSIQKVLGRIHGGPFSWAYLGQEILEFRQATRLLGDKGTYIDTTEEFHRTAQTLRGPYLAYLYRMGEQLDSLHWWVTSLSYRASSVSRAFRQACYLSVALNLERSLAGSAPLVILVDDPVHRALADNLISREGVRVLSLGLSPFRKLRPVLDAVRMVSHRAFFIVRESHRIFQSRRLCHQPYSASEPTVLLVSWVTPGNLSRGGNFHEAYFGDLAAQLGNRGCNVAVMPIVLREVGYKETLGRLRESSLPVVVPHRYLTLWDVLRAAVSSSSRPPSARPVPPFSGMEIKALVQEELRRHWIGNQTADALLVAALVKRWAACGFAISSIIYIYENQPWERSLCWQAKRSLPGTVLIGYQHARAPRLMLNFYLAPEGESESPQPDWVVTVGSHTANLLTQDGWEASRVRVGGALQMQELLRSGPQQFQPTPPGQAATVLVACSESLEETEELSDLALHLFSPGDGVRVVLKYHPRMPFEKVRSLMGTKLPPHVSVSDEPIVDLMANSSLMVYSGSTVCVQALAIGLPVVHLRTQFEFDLDPLGELADARLSATGLAELRCQVRWLLEHRDEYVAQHKEEWANLVTELYGPVTEETYRAFIA